MYILVSIPTNFDWPFEHGRIGPSIHLSLLRKTNYPSHHQTIMQLSQMHISRNITKGYPKYPLTKIRRTKQAKMVVNDHEIGK